MSTNSFWMDTVPTIPVISISLTGKEVGPWVLPESQLRSSLLFLRVETTRTVVSYYSLSSSFPSQPTLPFFLPPTSFPASIQWAPLLSDSLKDLPTPRAGPQKRKQLLASTENKKTSKFRVAFVYK